MQPLSVVLITLNEEHQIARTLAALGFADEIVVVDSLSSDRTVEICRAHGARVISAPFRGYGAQKRLAVSKATHDWVLCLDADELVDDALGAAIRALLAGGAPPCAAYALRFRNVFMGRVLRHGAPERHVRLFDRRRAAWTDARIHERVEADGPVGVLPGHVLHESVRDLSEAIDKLNAYTSSASLDLHGRPARGHASLVFSTAWHFFRHYVLWGLFLDGLPGLSRAMLFAVGSMTKHLKAAERFAHADPEPVPGPTAVAAKPAPGGESALA